jgi:hypothetical protein
MKNIKGNIHSCNYWFEISDLQEYLTPQFSTLAPTPVRSFLSQKLHQGYRMYGKVMLEVRQYPAYSKTWTSAHIINDMLKGAWRDTWHPHAITRCWFRKRLC